MIVMTRLNTIQNTKFDWPASITVYINGSFQLNSTNFKGGPSSTISELAEILTTCCKIYWMEKSKIFLQYLKYFLRYRGFRDPTLRRHITKLRDVHFLSVDISIAVQPNWMILFLPVQFFTCTVSSIDSKNATIIIVKPVSLAELNVKSAFIFSLYLNFPIFSDQYIHIYKAQSIHILYVYCLCGW